MSLAENQQQTVQVFVDGYNEWTEEGILRARSADCVHAVLPASMGRPDSSNKEYAEFFGQLKDVVQGFKMTPLKVVNDPEQHMAVLHARGTGESPVGPYRNEYSLWFTFNEDGTKITRIEEFLDSAFGAVHPQGA